MDSDHLGLISLFVDNLPKDVGLFWFKKFFSQYGVVKDAYIPCKRSKVTNRRFGFVRFDCAISAEVAISKANGFWIEDRMLYVNMATFKAQRKNPNRIVENSASQLSQKCFMESHPQMRGHNEERPTYAQVTRGVERFGEKLANKMEKMRSHEKLIDVNLDDSGSTAKVVSGGSDYDDWDLVLDEPLLKASSGRL
ncbi:hypothetical protein Vadar_028690 [Vaccinium darrowii]|uniref:Uncharacterized protein n=1 Tax=Vaccinium darrowii TaxID=229202 RepID=A0ACB7YAT3_9ERIC|nr:hypothetical protein Vadar_028690 [Vaccinium darrowii]